MADQQEPYDELFCSGHFPEASDEVMDYMEDFLSFHVNSTPDFDFLSFISFYSSQFWEINQNPNLPEDVSKRLSHRLIHCFRLIRPSQMNSEIWQLIGPIAFTNLQLLPNNSPNSIIARESFLLLIDHFMSNPIDKSEDVSKLVEFILNVLISGSNPISNSSETDLSNPLNLLTMDLSLIFIIFGSFRSILSICQAQIRPYLEKIVGYLQKIAIISLQLQKEPYFFPDYELLAAKSLRTVALLIEFLRYFNKETIESLLEIQKAIPDDVKFIHIYQNFMTFACSVIDIACQQQMQSQQGNRRIDPQLLSFLKEKDIQVIIELIIQILPLFTHPPFNKSRRALTFFRTFKTLVKTNNTNSQNYVLPKVMPLLGHLQGQIPYLEHSFDLFHSYLTPDYLQKHCVQLDLFEQLITCLEMLRDEFDSIDFNSAHQTNSFEAEYWLESNTTIVKSMNILMQVKDQLDVSKFARVNDIMIRLFEYVDYFLDIVGLISTLTYGRNESSPQYAFILKQISPNKIKEKVHEFINTFISLLSKFPSPMLIYLFTFHLSSLIPKKTHHSYHSTLITHLARAFFQSKEKPHGFLFFLFSCLIKKFDYFFLNGSNSCLMELIGRLFSNVVDAFLKTQDQQNLQNLSNLMHKFMDLALGAQSKALLDLISAFLRIVRAAINKTELSFSAQQQQQPKMQPNVAIKPPQGAPTDHKMPHSAPNNSVMQFTPSMVQAFRGKTSTPMQIKGEPPTPNQQGQQIKIMANSTMSAVNVQSVAPGAIQTTATASSPRNKLEPLLNGIKKSQLLYFRYIMKNIEDPKLELSASLFAIYLYPLLNVSQESIDFWVNFFLPALENEMIRPKVMPLLYETFNDNLANWMAESKLKEATRQRLIKALSKDTHGINHILTKIPYFAISHAINQAQPSSDPAVENTPESIIVTYETTPENLPSEGLTYLEKIDDFYKKEKIKQKLPYAVIINSMERISKPTDEQLDALLVCFISFVGQLSFIISVSHRLVCQTCDYFKRCEKLEMICEAYQRTKTPKELYSFLYLKEKYGSESIQQLVCDGSIISDLPDFVLHINMLCACSQTIATAAQILSYVLPLLPNDLSYARTISALLQATLYQPKLIKQIFREHFYTRQFDPQSDSEVLLMLKNHFWNAFLQSFSHKQFNHVSIKGLDFILTVLKAKNFIDQNYKKFVVDIPKIPIDIKSATSHFRNDFIFLREFNDIADPELALKILKVFSMIDLSEYDETTRKALKLNSIHESARLFELAKFFLKTIIKMLPYLKPGCQIWEELFQVLRSEKLKAILPFFYKEIKKNAQFGYQSMPSLIVPIKQAKLASNDYNSNQSSSNSSQISPSPSMNIRASSPGVNQTTASKQQAQQQKSAQIPDFSAVAALKALATRSSGRLTQQMSPSKKGSKSTASNQATRFLENFSSAQFAITLSNLNSNSAQIANVSNPSLYMNQQSHVSPITTPDDIKFAYIAIEYCPQPQLSAYIQWMVTVISSYTAGIQSSQFEKIQNGLIGILKTIKLIRKIDPRCDMIRLFKAFFEFMSKIKKLVSPISVPIYKLAKIDALTTGHALLSLLKTKWDADLFDIGCSLFVHKKCITFRNRIMGDLANNLLSIIQYINDNASSDVDFVLNKTFSTLAQCFDTLETTEMNVYNALHLAKILFDEVLRKEYKPNYLFCFTRIFLPKRFASEIESIPELYEFYVSHILPLFMFAPNHFYHPLFPRKFVEFMKMLSISTRLDIWMNKLPTLQNNHFAQILINQLRAELYMAFPYVDKEGTGPIPKRDLRVRFIDYPVLKLVPPTNIFISYLLNYTGAMIGLQNPQLKITDLSDNPLSEVSAQVHALFIRNGLKDGSSIRTVHRFAGIARELSNYSDENVEKFEELDGFVTSLDSTFMINYDRTLLHLFSNSPFVTKPNNVCFKLFQKPNFIIKKPSKQLMRYLLLIVTNLLENSHKISNQFISILPSVLKTFNTNDVHLGDERFLELLMYTISVLLEKFNELISSNKFMELLSQKTPEFFSAINDVIKTSQFLLSPLELYTQVDFDKINHNLLNKIKSILSNKQTFEVPQFPPNAEFPQCSQFLTYFVMKIKFVYHIIISLSPFLYHNDKDFIPYGLLPSKTWSALYFPQGRKEIRDLISRFQKDLLTQYQKVVQTSVESNGITLANKLIEYVYKNNTNQAIVFTEVLKTPFATLAEWMKIKEIKQDQALLTILNIFTSSMKPATKEIFLLEATQFKQPLNQRILMAIDSLKSTFDIENTFVNFPALYQLSVKYVPKDNIFELLNAAFHIDWFKLEESTHVPTFLRLVLPDVFHPIIFHLRESEMHDIIFHNLIEIDSRFFKFMAFYVYSFPKSSLSTVFTLHPLFNLSDPLPGCSLYDNMSFLECRNDWSDSLGLLQKEFPQLLYATSFHEIGHYTAARYSYIIDMMPVSFFIDRLGYKTQYKHSSEDFYFHALNKLRNCYLNETLPSTPNLREYVLTANNGSSKITLPILQDSPTLFDMSQLSIGESYIEDPLTSYISPSYVPMYFRASLYEEIRLFLRISAGNKQISTTDLDRISRMPLKSLDHMNAMSSNFTLRFLMLDDFTTNCSQFENNLIFSKGPPQFPKYIKGNHENDAILLAQTNSCKYLIKELEKADGCKIVDMVTKANLPRILNFLSRNNKSIFLRWDTLLLLRDIKSVLQYPFDTLSSKQKLKFYITNTKIQDQMNFQSIINPADIITTLFSELFKCDPSDKYAILSLIIKYAKKESEFKTFHMCLEQVPDVYLDLFLEWLPVIFKNLGRLPTDFMHKLLNYHTPYFLLQIHHLHNSRLIQDKNYLPEFINNLKKGKDAVELFETSFQFAQTHDKETQAPYLSIKIIQFIYSRIGRPAANIPEGFLSFGKDIDELSQFIENNPPVFQTKTPINFNISGKGYRLPRCPYSVIRMNIESDGINEAHLNFTTIRGDKKSYLLLPFSAYKHTTSEYLLCHYLNRIIAPRNESSSMLYYPQAFLIHPFICMVDSPEASNLQSICKPYSIYKYMKSMVDCEGDTSPKDLHERRRNNALPSDLLFKWFVKGSKGMKNNFLFMRRSFALHLGSISYLHTLFKLKETVTPPVIFLNDRQRLCYSGFTDLSTEDKQRIRVQFSSSLWHSLALQPQLAGLLPEYVLKGSFATSWHTLADAVNKSEDNIKVFLEALLSSDSESTNRFFDTIMYRARLLAIQTSEDTDKSDEYFPFLILDRLIEMTQNTLNFETNPIGWI